MKKYWKIILFSLLALVFVGMFLFLWQKSKPQPTVYEEFTPTIKDIAKTTVVTGKIEPRDEVNIKPQISGIIANLYKEAGQMVKKDVGSPVSATSIPTSLSILVMSLFWIMSEKRSVLNPPAL